MRPSRSASTCAGVAGLTCPDKLAEGAAIGRPAAASNLWATGWAGQAQADGIEAGARQITGLRCFGQRQHQRERPRPKSLGQFFGAVVETPFPPRQRHIGDMGDERVETRAAFGAINARHGAGVGCVGAKPVNGLGRKSHQPARAQDFRRRADPGGVGRQQARVFLLVSFPFRF